MLAIDYGKRRVGLAVSDELQITANALETVVMKTSQTAFFDRLKLLCQQKKVVGIVIGKPLNMDGSEGVMVEIARNFARRVHQATGLPVVFWDERLTSIQAKNALKAYGKKPSKNKATIDKLAATFLLQNFLDSRSR